MKKWLGPLPTVWLGLSTHKLRSFLTMLGIIIGVASVITLMSIGRGATADILSRVNSLGPNLITIRPGATFSGGVRSAAGSAVPLTLEDAATIKEQVSSVTAVAPVYSRNLQVIVGSKNTNTPVSGVTTDYVEVANLTVASGAFFTAQEYQSGASVAVLGSNVKTTLFGDADAEGQPIRLGNIVLRVIGVLNSKGATFGSPDDAVFVPLTVMQQTVAQPRTTDGGHGVSTISLTVSDEKQASDAVAEITSLLRTRRHLSPSKDNDFTVSSVEELAATVSQITGTMTLLLGAIAGISLLVGGIGVMNIMLVSVLERTREIGIRKALGARERDIWTQFLVEAAFLCFTGGIIGVIVGWMASYIVASTGLLKTLVTPDIIVLAVSVSVGIGLFFGFYPAWNASRLDPIESLRSE
ncbi:MAG: ABC transporter permease [Chloroflexi bacterium]|nr:ABC transporter permease [Chloroflexota bacterium]